MNIPEQEQDNIENNLEDQESISPDTPPEKDSRKSVIIFSTFVPLIFIAFLLVSFTNDSIFNEKDNDEVLIEVNSDNTVKNTGRANILSDEDLSRGLKDTVYTDMDCWLELRVHEQMLYQHWRDGKLTKYPVSTGNKYISKGVEARPGLFAIFYRNPHHKSVQFNDAALYHFMTFNQGIGFHSLAGTGYYASLGVRPVSHGCIRMTRSDARQLFSDCPMGTLVLVHFGSYSRTIDFAPKDFKNERDYSKEEYKSMLAENLRNVIDGKYYIKGRQFFVIDPKIIPVSGVYIGYDKKIPDKQILPKNSFRIVLIKDRLNVTQGNSLEILDSSQVYEELSLYDNFITINNSDSDTLNIAISSEDLVKKFFHNPIGILPYFPPSKSSDFDEDLFSGESDTEESGTDESSTIESNVETSTPETAPETPSSDDGGLEE